MSLWEGPIRDSTLAFVSAALDWRFGGPVAVWTLVFWIGCAGWAVLLAFRLQIDDHVSDERNRDLWRAIVHAPNVLVVRDYPVDYFPRALQAAGQLRLASIPTSAEEAAERVRQVLRVIAQLARDFAEGKSAHYGANIMLVADKSQFQELAPRVRFLQSQGELQVQRAALYLPDALKVDNLSEGGTRHVPLIALPVPEEEYSSNGFGLALPGAPTALLSGAPSIFMDTRQLDEECEDLSAAVRTSIAQYFGPHGEGKHIRSFASYRIGRAPETPIGVLNIDSDSVCVLGSEEDYYPTFTAMLEPLLALLAPLVSAYADLAGPALLSDAQPSEAGRESIDPTPTEK